MKTAILYGATHSPTVTLLLLSDMEHAALEQRPSPTCAELADRLVRIEQLPHPGDTETRLLLSSMR